MKNFQKILFVALVLAVTVSVLDACKKGPEDPFLSFRSRKSRIVGDWVATTYTINGVDQLVEIEYDTIAQSPVCTGTIGYFQYVTTTYTLKPILTFQRNGDYINEDYSRIDVVSDFEIDTSNLCKDANYMASDTSIVSTGTWVFGGGVGAERNKEMLVIIEPKDNISTTWDIVECRNKSLKLERTYQDGANNSQVLRMTLEPYTP